MKTNKQKLLEYISNDIIIYLKSGKLCLNPFLKKANLNIEDFNQLLNIHFLLHKDVQKYILELPVMIRKFKTSTKMNKRLFISEVKGRVNWNKTIQTRFNFYDNTIFLCDEKNKWYSIKENLVLKEFIKILYNIMFFKINIDNFTKYKWFQNGNEMKKIIKNIYEKNIYLSRIKGNGIRVTNRMIEDTIKSRNLLYREAAKLLKLYRKIINYNLNKDEVNKLLMETFIDVSDESTLFELYWVLKIIKDNAVEEKMYIVDGTNNMIASWEDGLYKYCIYHDSTGSKELNFKISLEEIEDIENEYIKRKIIAIKNTRQMGKTMFKDINDRFNYFWDGRPDIIIEIREKKTNKLTKVIFGEVKHTLNKDYALQGLKELMEYIMLVKETAYNNFICNNEKTNIKIKGILFLDRISYEPVDSDIVRVISFNEEEKVYIE